MKCTHFHTTSLHIITDTAHLSRSRYKIVVQTTVGQLKDQGIRVASRCLWDPNTDNYSSTSFSNVCVVDLFLHRSVFLFAGLQHSYFVTRKLGCGRNLLSIFVSLTLLPTSFFSILGDALLQCPSLRIIYGLTYIMSS